MAINVRSAVAAIATIVAVVAVVSPGTAAADERLVLTAPFVGDGAEGACGPQPWASPACVAEGDADAATGGLALRIAGVGAGAGVGYAYNGVSLYRYGWGSAHAWVTASHAVSSPARTLHYDVVVDVETATPSTYRGAWPYAHARTEWRVVVDIVHSTEGLLASTSGLLSAGADTVYVSADVARSADGAVAPGQIDVQVTVVGGSSAAAGHTGCTLVGPSCVGAGANGAALAVDAVLDAVVVDIAAA